MLPAQTARIGVSRQNASAPMARQHPEPRKITTTMNMLKTQLAELQQLETNTYGKDFLLTWEKTDAEIRALLLLAECLSELHKAGRPFRIFETGPGGLHLSRQVHPHAVQLRLGRQRTGAGAFGVG